MLYHLTCVGPSSRIRIHFSLLSTRAEELISTPKIIALEPNPPAGDEKDPLLSNEIPNPKYLFLSISAFFS